MSSEVTYLPGSTPLVLDSPHSGTQYPDDFGSALDLATLRRAEAVSYTHLTLPTIYSV